MKCNPASSFFTIPVFFIYKCLFFYFTPPIFTMTVSWNHVICLLRQIFVLTERQSCIIWPWCNECHWSPGIILPTSLAFTWETCCCLTRQRQIHCSSSSCIYVGIFHVSFTFTKVTLCQITAWILTLLLSVQRSFFVRSSIFLEQTKRKWSLTFMRNLWARAIVCMCSYGQNIVTPFFWGFF